MARHCLPRACMTSAWGVPGPALAFAAAKLSRTNSENALAVRVFAGVPSTLNFPRKARLLRQRPHRMRAVLMDRECRLNTSPHLQKIIRDVTNVTC